MLENGGVGKILDYFTYANYPDIVFADLRLDPVLLDETYYVLEVEGE